MSAPEIHARLQNYLETQLPFFMDSFKKMVDINSFTTNRNGVNRLGHFTAELFAELGFQAETVPAENPMHGDHLILRRPGRSPATVGMVSHLDTVFAPAEERRNDFRWREEGDRIYGPGTVDIKGGTIVIFMMLAALRAELPLVYDQVSWSLLLNAAEEDLAEDFGRLCRRELADRGLACLVFEGGETVNGDWSVVVTRKGRAMYRISVEGKGAHAGAAHHEGANALVQLARTIQQVAELTDYEKDLTFNIGVAAGGTVLNRVPHQASAAVEMRAFSPMIFEEGVKAMLTLNGGSYISNRAGDYCCRVDIELLKQTAPWSENEASQRLLAIWQAAGRELGRPIAPQARGGLSDGNWLWQLLPTIDGLGPQGDNSHCSEQSGDGAKEQEYVLKSSFVPKTMLNLVALLKLLEADR